MRDAVTTGTNAALILIAASGAVFLSAAQEYWWLAPLISVIAAVLVLWFNAGRPWLRARRLMRPVKAFLTLYPDGGHDSWATEIHVPLKSEIRLSLRIRPRFHYRQMEI